MRQNIYSLIVQAEDAPDALARCHERPVPGANVRIELQVLGHLAPAPEYHLAVVIVSRSADFHRSGFVDEDKVFSSVVRPRLRRQPVSRLITGCQRRRFARGGRRPCAASSHLADWADDDVGLKIKMTGMLRPAIEFLG